MLRVEGVIVVKEWWLGKNLELGKLFKNTFHFIFIKIYLLKLFISKTLSDKLNKQNIIIYKVKKFFTNYSVNFIISGECSERCSLVRE